MARDPLNPDDVAFLFVEPQPPIVQSSRTVPADALVKTIATAVSIAEGLQLPVLPSIVRLSPDWPSDLIEPLASYEPLVRSTPGMLDDEAVLDMLRDKGRSAVAIGGVSSEIGILHTALGGLRRGFRVYLLADCCGGLSGRTEDAAFREAERAGATISNLSSFATGLVRRMDDPIAGSVFPALAAHWGWET